MVKHQGPKISKAGATLTSPKSGSKAKTEAAKILVNHKNRMH